MATGKLPWTITQELVPIPVVPMTEEEMEARHCGKSQSQLRKERGH